MPHDLQLTTLKPWVEIPGLERVAGVGTYTTTVRLPADWTAADRGAWLDLGTVLGTVRLWVNGGEVGPGTVAAGRRWDVSALLKPGANELRVELATALRNAVPSQFPVAFRERYGLLGPVTLTPFGRAAIDLRAPPPQERPPVVTPPGERPPGVTPPPARRAAGRVVVTAARAARLSQLGARGLRVSVRLPRRGAVAATLSARLPGARRAVALARANRSASRAATVVVPLRPRAAALARLRAALRTRRAVTATIATRVTLAGGTRTTKRLRLVIRR